MSSTALRSRYCSGTESKATLGESKEQWAFVDTQDPQLYFIHPASPPGRPRRFRPHSQGAAPTSPIRCGGFWSIAQDGYDGHGPSKAWPYVEKGPESVRREGVYCFAWGVHLDARSLNQIFPPPVADVTAGNEPPEVVGTDHLPPFLVVLL